MPDLPTGTVTFFFTDIEGSTRLWEQNPVAMEAALARHDALLRQAIEGQGGHVFKTVGDQFCAVFATAPDALAAALQGQRLLRAQSWPGTGPLRVRMALHTGAAQQRGGDYFGPPLNRVARLLEAGHGDQVLLSLAAQELARDYLPEGAGLRDLGEHRLKDLVRPERVLQLLHPDLPDQFPLLAGLNVRPNNLPAQPTPLLGREHELAALRALLGKAVTRHPAAICGEAAGTQSSADGDDRPAGTDGRQPAANGRRLITLTGPGGTGKTRLALQVAADLLDDFTDGVFFVNLAPISDPHLVAAAIAQTLGVRESGGEPVAASLQQHLAGKQLLLLLDNFEQILGAAPLVADLLAAAPGLKLLVTSRAILRLRGEQEFPVPPLAVPDPKWLPSLSALSQYAAVELFVQRAVSAKPEFALTNENAPAVAEICHRLDGLPLAIELAAARIKLFAPQALLARLQSRLRLLTGGARDLPERQQTLRSAIAWSYDLLDAAEQALFRRLAVFVGGCTLEAAEAVCSSGEGLAIDALEGITLLVDKSLLRQEEVGGEPRLGMLETIREYGQEALAQSGEAAGVQRAHAQFFLALVEEAELQLGGPEQGVWLERLEREHDNLRAVLEWCHGHAEDPLLGLRMTAALRWFWDRHSHLSEGRQHLARALSRETGRNAERAWALYAAGYLARRQADHAAARALCEASLAIARELNDRARVASVLRLLGDISQDRGDFQNARSLMEESLAIHRELGPRIGVAAVLNNMGLTAVYQQRFQEACGFLEESLMISRQLGDCAGTSCTLNNLGMAALGQQDWAGAQSLFAESLKMKWELGMRMLCAWGLEGLAGVAAARGQAERAARLFGAADAVREAEGHPANAPEREVYDPYQAAARAQLGDEAFTGAWAEGRAISLETAVEYALQPEGTAAGE